MDQDNSSGLTHQMMSKPITRSPCRNNNLLDRIRTEKTSNYYTGSSEYKIISLFKKTAAILLKLVTTSVTARSALRNVILKLLEWHSCPFIIGMVQSIADKIPLDDVRRFTIKTPSYKSIVYEITPTEHWVLSKLYWNRSHIFEAESLAIFYQRLSKARTILDIGAYFGYYALLAATEAPEAKVVAFEPMPFWYAKILRTIEANSLINVMVEHRAISNTCGIMPFYVNKVHPTMSTLFPSKDEDLKQFEKIEVEVITIDEYSVKRDLRNIDLVKIDVEGFEAEVLQGMITILKRDRPDIICEVLPVDNEEKKRKRDVIRNILTRNSYMAYWISPNGLIRDDEIIGHQPFSSNYLLTPSH